MTLSIFVSEQVTAIDVLVTFVRRALKRVHEWAAILFEEEPVSEPAPTEDNKAPPTLGISVGEETKISEALG